MFGLIAAIQQLIGSRYPYGSGCLEPVPVGGGQVERLTAGVKMREITRGPEPFRGVISPLPHVPATRPRATSTAEPKPQSGPPANIFPSRPDCPLTAEQERLMVEHLPIVRFIARHIHKRLPQHVAIEDVWRQLIFPVNDNHNSR